MDIPVSCAHLGRKHRFGHQAVTSVLGLITVWYLRRRIEGTCYGGHGGHGSSARQCTLLLPAGALKPPLDGPSQILPAMIGTLQDMMEKRWKKWVIDDDFLIFFGCLSNLSSWHCLFSGWLGLGFDTWWLMLGYPADHRRSNGAAQTKRFPAGRIIAQKMGGLPSHANHVWPDGTLQ